MAFIGEDEAFSSPKNRKLPIFVLGAELGLQRNAKRLRLWDAITASDCFMMKELERSSAFQ
jgi:hypothetical protein